MRERFRMKKRTPSRDPNVAASRLVAALTGEPAPRKSSQRKNPAAVALGRKGGLVGGKARAESMTAKQRRASAKKAAKARWARKAS
jgi:hypothetical protein